MAGEKYKWWGDDRETAELIWCAAHLHCIIAPPSFKNDLQPSKDLLSSTDRGASTEKPLEDSAKITPPVIEETEPRTPIAVKNPDHPPAPLEQRESSSSDRASPIRVPDPFPLPNPAEISKGLLPLAKRVPGILANELDIDTTVDQTAEANGLLSLAFHPPLERWFEVHLLIDHSPSMAFWGDLAEGADRRHLTILRHQEQAQCFIEDLGNGVQLEMVAIPGGSFLMGSPEDELQRVDTESPQHRVSIRPFFMGKYPVTQAQWKAIASLPQVKRELKPDPSRFKGEDRPVEGVSWYDAVEFCDRVTRLVNEHRLTRFVNERRLSKDPSKSYQLPSESQWEYACRAGTTTPFHFGETITSNLANYNANRTYGVGVKGIYRGETTPVGSFGVANAFGLYDMHGNVWEWCADHWHSNYEGGPNDETVWLSSDERYMLVRGGSWFGNPGLCRCASRYDYPGDDDYDLVGFRVVCGVL